MVDILFFDRDGDVTAALSHSGYRTFTGEVSDVVATAVVSPANSFGFMDGGIDYAYSQLFGWCVQERLMAELQKRPFGELLVGEALAIETNHRIPWVISAPTMRVPKRIVDPADVMLATRAAVKLASDMGMETIAIPGMGTGCGALHPTVAAKAMLAGVASALNPVHRPSSWQEAQLRHFQLEG